MSPPNYHEDFLIYLVASNSIVGMVLIQANVDHVEHVIYSLSRGLVSAELRYPYVEKLALEAAFVVQRFQHYIILQSTTVISNSNPM